MSDNEHYRVLSLFSGIGGLERGLELAGMHTIGQVEADKNCREILVRHWPDTQRWEDVRDVPHIQADVICGGDPCPSRSRARGNRPSRHPDLAGHFLAVVGRCRPRWVVRENVPAPNALDFALGLATLGYGIVAIELDARDFTGQSRRRQFLLGCPPERTSRLAAAISNAADGHEFVSSGRSETTPIAACITAHPSRLAAEDTYCFEPGRGLRFLDPTECESLQGFPRGWTSGVAHGRRRRMLGNAVCVPVAEWIGKRILEAA